MQQHRMHCLLFSWLRYNFTHPLCNRIRWYHWEHNTHRYESIIKIWHRKEVFAVQHMNKNCISFENNCHKVKLNHEPLIFYSDSKMLCIVSRSMFECLTHIISGYINDEMIKHLKMSYKMCSQWHWCLFDSYNETEVDRHKNSWYYRKQNQDFIFYGRWFL